MRKLLAALLAFAVLAGCGDRLPPGTIVIRVGNWGGAKEGNDYDKLVAQIYRDFEKKNPGIVIREEGVPDDYVAKMSLAYIAGAEPDILMLDASSAARFIQDGMVADLAPLIAKDPTFRPSDFFPNVFGIAKRSSAVYAIPQDFTPMVVYYNKKLFDQARIPYPTPDWDFAKFREIAAKLTDPARRQYGFAFTNWPAGWVMWIWNNGGEHIAPDGKRAVGYLDSPRSVEAISFLRDLVKSGYAPSISQTAALGVDPFANGQAAMAISGHWALIGYQAAPKDPATGKPKITWDDLGVVCLPHNVPESKTVMYESGYAIGGHCRHKEAAWKFIRYMTSHRVQALYQSSGIAVCARRDVAEERAASSPLEAEFIPIIPTARPPTGSWLVGYEFVEDQMQKAMDAILQSGRDPYQALHEAARRIEREWKKD